MPVEIRELIIKATVALDWENKTVQETNENIVCIKWPGEKAITVYVEDYFNQQKERELMFDESKLREFLLDWQASLVK